MRSQKDGLHIRGQRMLDKEIECAIPITPAYEGEQE